MIYPIKIISEANIHEHWAKKAKRVKDHRRAGWAIIRSLKVILPVVVILTRIGVRKLDGDNLQIAFKALRDGIADGFGVADNDPRLVFRYDQRTGKPKEYAVDITFENLELSAKAEGGNTMSKKKPQEGGESKAFKKAEMKPGKMPMKAPMKGGKCKKC